jgi:hypothetical protein
MNPQRADNQGEEVSEWFSAPEGSHVAGFQFIDRSKSEFAATSELIVTYKGKNGKPPATYSYKLNSHESLRNIFESLKGAEHPGALIDAQLKKANVPYKRIS